MPPGHFLTAACVRHADRRQKEGSEADLPRLTVKGGTCRGGLLIDPPGRFQRDPRDRASTPHHCPDLRHAILKSSISASAPDAKCLIIHPLDLASMVLPPKATGEEYVI
jgi:hypothetical protein